MIQSRMDCFQFLTCPADGSQEDQGFQNNFLLFTFSKIQFSSKSRGFLVKDITMLAIALADVFAQVEVIRGWNDFPGVSEGC